MTDSLAEFKKTKHLKVSFTTICQFEIAFC